MFYWLTKRKKNNFKVGRVRKDRSTKRLLQRIRAKEIALIDHRDLDWTAAEGLVRRGVKVVLNQDSFCSGLFPPLALQFLLRQGVHLVENLGESFFEEVVDGELLEVAGGTIYRRGLELARGDLLTQSACEQISQKALRQRESVVEEFVVNTLDYAYRERGLITGEIQLPPVETEFQDHDAVVVIRGKGFHEDLRAIKSYLYEKRPVLVGVDGGGDALLECGLTPDLIVGDMDSVSDRALQQARELVVHAYPDGRGVPGRERLERLGLKYHLFSAPGTSEDIALLLAHDLGAALIVAVGAHFSVTEFLEKGRPGMASTFLVRLKVGDRLIDAKGVSRLYQPRAVGFLIPVVIAAGLTPLLTMVFFSPTIQHLFRLFIFRLKLLP
ncbi:MAG: putative cytokinetic ring protein SteA [Dethiobacteria bacterium]